MNYGQWTEAAESKLREMWAAGLSARQCATEFGNVVSRNAIIGKVHRMGLERRRTVVSSKPRRTDGDREKGRTVRKRNVAVRKVAKPVFKAPPVEKFKPEPEALAVGAWNALPGSTPIILLELSEGTCKWPIGDGPPFMFCGCAVSEGSSYCPTHRHIGTGSGTESERRAVRDAKKEAGPDRRTRDWMEAA